MTYEQIDAQHAALIAANQNDAIAQDAIYRATALVFGAVLETASTKDSSTDALKGQFSEGLKSFADPNHQQLFREAFGLTAKALAAGIQEVAAERKVKHAIA